jgi:hypothetical protein
VIEELLAKMEFGNRTLPPQGKKPTAWSQSDLAAVREHYPRGGSPEVLKHLPTPRTIRAIQEQAALMDLSAPGRWTRELDAIVLEHYTAKGADEVAILTGRTVFAVRRRAAALGIRADRSRAGVIRWAKQERKPNPAKAAPKRQKINNPALTVMKPRDRKPKPAPWHGEVDMSRAKVTIAPPFVDRRFVPDGPVRSVVDSAQCRAWAMAAA